MSRWKRLTPLLFLVLLASCAPHPAPNVPSATARTSKTTQQPPPSWEAPWTEPKAAKVLYRQFLELSKSPEDYAKRIGRDAAAYPEGAILALALPTYALANHAMAHPESAAECQGAIDRLIQLASQRWAREWLEVPMREDVHKLRRWNGHGVYLGHYCLMLCCYRLAGGDGKYAEHQQQIAEVLRQGFRSQRGGAWVPSYPHRAWAFDCLPCLLAVRLTDVQDGRDLNASGKLVADHLRFRQTVALDEATGFACTEMDPRTGRPLAGARGCAIAGSICFLGHLAPAHCRDLYARFKESYWIEQGEGSGKIVGFREWPREHDGFMDVDSGPIVTEVGAAASGFGLGASRFARDRATHEALLDSLDKAVAMIDTARTASAFSQRMAQLMQSQGIVAESDVEQLTATFKGLDQDLAISKDYRYRHLMADAVAFYCLTWRPWCEAAVEGTGGERHSGGRQ